jgi:hypothetical protein
MRRLLLLAVLAACRTPGGSSEDASAGPAPPDGPSEWPSTPDDDAPDARFDVDAVELALDEVLTGMTTVGAEPVITAYDALMASTDGSCPAWYENEGNVFWYSRCTTSGGTFFDGYGFTYVFEDAEVFGPGGGYWDLTQVTGAATIRDASGHTFHLGGAAYEGAGTNEYGARLWVSNVLGGFVWDAPEAEGTWLSRGVSPGLLLYAIRYPPGSAAGIDGNYLYVQGTVGGLGEAATGAQLDMAVADTSLGFPCDLEPMGTVSLRDADGTWWDVTFDVTTDGERYEMTGDCDGCGAVTLHGAYVGEACADFAPLLDWTERPW